MIKKIAFYISSAEKSRVIRSAVIIDTLLKLEEDLEIFVKAEESQITYLRGYMKEKERISYYIEEPDPIPMPHVRKGEMNLEKLTEEVEAFVDEWDDLAEKEKEFLLEKEIGLVISDICPWIFLAADDLRVKSILMTDAGWDQIFKGWLPEEMLDSYRECYELASKVYLYDLHHPDLENLCGDYEKLSLMLRPHNIGWIEEQMMRKEVPMIYLELEEEPELSGKPYQFVVSPKMKVKGDNVIQMEDWTNDTHNYIAACDYVIANGDWNTLSEALLTNKKIALLTRTDAVCEQTAAALLEERSQCIIIEENDLNDIDGIIARLEDFSYSYDTEYHNDDYEAAKKILMEYPKRRRRKRT